MSWSKEFVAFVVIVGLFVFGSFVVRHFNYFSARFAVTVVVVIAILVVAVINSFSSLIIHV